MKYVQIFLLTCMTLSTSIATAHSGIGQEKFVMENIETQLNDCRHLLQEQVNNNLNVLKQFDQFANFLKITYQSGEGLTNRDVQRIIDTIAFSAEKHRFQTRKDPDQTPYIIHPIGVAHNLMVIGKVRDPEIIIGALLHDTVEDTQTSFEEIEQRFGIRVAGFIKEVTDDKSLPKHKRKELQIEHAPDKSAGAAQIKLADKLYNLSDLAKAPPSDWEQERIDAYFQWAKAVVDGLPWVNAPLKQAVDDVIQAYWKNQP